MFYSAYRPIELTHPFLNTLLVNLIAKVKCDIYINGSLYTSFYIDKNIEKDMWICDVSGVCQTYLAPNSNGISEVFGGTEKHHCKVYAKMSAYKSVNGFLEPTGETYVYVTDEVNVINATTDNLGNGLPLQYGLLTNRPIPYCKDDGANVSVLLGSGMRAIVVDSDNQSAFLKNNLGVNQLNVPFGHKLLIDNGTNVEIINFDFIDCDCCDYLYLSWLNKLGGYDEYKFCQFIEYGHESKSKQAYKPLNWADTLPYHNSSDFGLFKYSTESYRNIEVSELVTSEVGVWLTDLLDSPEVYININGNLVPCVVYDSNVIYSDKNNSHREIRLKLRYANNLITQNR